VWIHRGVLHSATNESQVAGVLAHEIAHIAQRHAADQLTSVTLTNWGLGLLGAVLGNSGGAGAAQIAAGFLANGVFLKFSRDDEREADRVGLDIMRRAGWDGRGMVELFDILRRESARDPGSVEVFFSSHPSPQDRMAQLREKDLVPRAEYDAAVSRMLVAESRYQAGIEEVRNRQELLAERRSMLSLARFRTDESYRQALEKAARRHRAEQICTLLSMLWRKLSFPRGADSVRAMRSTDASPRS